MQDTFWQTSFRGSQQSGVQRLWQKELSLENKAQRNANTFQPSTQSEPTKTTKIRQCSESYMAYLFFRAERELPVQPWDASSAGENCQMRQWC